MRFKNRQQMIDSMKKKVVSFTYGKSRREPLNWKKSFDKEEEGRQTWQM